MGYIFRCTSVDFQVTKIEKSRRRVAPFTIIGRFLQKKYGTDM